jgi:hypothetical protein
MRHKSARYFSVLFTLAPGLFGERNPGQNGGPGQADKPRQFGRILSALRGVLKGSNLFN